MEEDSVVWDDAYSVGFEPIDDQHKVLVAMINELLHACKKRVAVADVAFLQTVQKAVEYAQTHFSAEENYMSQVSYPNLAAHKEQHRQFEIQIASSLKEFEKGGAAPIDLARFLKNWLLGHIAQSDKQYAPYLKRL